MFNLPHGSSSATSLDAARRAAAVVRPPPSSPARPPDAFTLSRRLRRRGPRYFISRCLRSTRRVSRTKNSGNPPGAARGEPRAEPPVPDNVGPDSHLYILVCNIRSLRLHGTELTARTETDQPDIIALTETWLDDSIEHVPTPSYYLMSRRDRADGRAGGGVCFYTHIRCRCATFIAHSASVEWSWHHLVTGGILVLLGIWYRPRDAELSDVTCFANELRLLSLWCCGIAVVGDMNIHHQKTASILQSKFQRG